MLPAHEVAASPKTSPKPVRAETWDRICAAGISQLLLADGDTDPSNSEHLTAAGQLWCDIFWQRDCMAKQRGPSGARVSKLTYPMVIGVSYPDR